MAADIPSSVIDVREMLLLTSTLCLVWPYPQRDRADQHKQTAFRPPLDCSALTEFRLLSIFVQGKTVGDTFIVLDAFALPVEGTETRVNAQAEAYEYMVDFVQASKAVGRREHVIGW